MGTSYLSTQGDCSINYGTGITEKEQDGHGNQDQEQAFRRIT